MNSYITIVQLVDQLDDIIVSWLNKMTADPDTVKIRIHPAHMI